MTPETSSSTSPLFLKRGDSEEHVHPRKRQAEGFDDKAQEALRAALPLRRTIDLSDGDCVLISTGRFHGVEPYEAEDGSSSSSSSVPYRLSGQCWLSYRQGKPLRMWV